MHAEHLHMSTGLVVYDPNPKLDKDIARSEFHDSVLRSYEFSCLRKKQIHIFASPLVEKKVGEESRGSKCGIS